MNKNTNNIKRKGLMFVLSSPSGAGKTSLSKKLLELDDEIFLSISYTTRPPRPGEIEGKEAKNLSSPQVPSLANQ